MSDYGYNKVFHQAFPNLWKMESENETDNGNYSLVTKTTISVFSDLTTFVTANEENYTTTDPTTNPTVITYYVITLPLGICIFLANLSTLGFLFFEKLLRHPANHYIASLAMADMGVGIFLIVVTFTLVPYGSLPNCLLHLCFITTICSVSIFSILAIAVDRYIFLVKAIFYYQRPTFRHSIMIVVIIWISGILIGFFPIMEGNDYTSMSGKCSVMNAVSSTCVVIIVTLFLLFPVVIIVLLYGRILHLAIQQRRKHLKQTERFDPEPSRVSSGISWRGIAILRGLRAAKVVIAIVGVFLITWIPYFISIFVQVLCGANCQAASTASAYLLLLGCSNSLINPCIYAFFGMEIRGVRCFSCKPFLKILPRIRTVSWRVM